MNKFKVARYVIVFLVALSILGFYTYLGFFGDSALLTLGAILIWLVVVFLAFIELILWLKKKENLL